MCYALILSTTSAADLAQSNRSDIKFIRDIPNRLSTDRLRYSNKWYIGSRTGCSCSFRHLAGPAFDFGIPEDWFPEEKSDIEATLAFIRLVRSLLASGEQVDCIDLWEGDGGEKLAETRRVDLSTVRDDEFRFFENHHFEFTLE